MVVATMRAIIRMMSPSIPIQVMSSRSITGQLKVWPMKVMFRSIQQQMTANQKSLSWIMKKPVRMATKRLWEATPSTHSKMSLPRVKRRVTLMCERRDSRRCPQCFESLCWIRSISDRFESKHFTLFGPSRWITRPSLRHTSASLVLYHRFKTFKILLLASMPLVQVLTLQRES